jgi:tRNA(Ile)-lysidine synthase
MLQELIHTINQRLKSIEKPKLLVAVSGGIDSSLLWYVIEQSQVPYAVAHLNFCLRGNESDLDEEMIVAKAKQLNVQLHLKRHDAKKEAEARSLSIQEASRNIRYAFFEELMRKEHYTHLLTAHHLNDSFETFLINLNRGTGLNGLTGIAEGERVWRPLLNYSKEQIHSMAKAIGLSYREDASNAEVKYLRNFFRHEIIAKWETKNPQILETMQANMQWLQEYRELIEEYMAEKLAVLKEELKEGSISYSSIGQLKHPKLPLIELLRPYGFNPDQIVNCLDLIDSEFKSGKKFETESHLLILDREALLLVEKSNIKNQDAEYALNIAAQHLEIPFNIEFSLLQERPLDLQTEQVYYLDFGSLQKPFILRKWREGDRIQPLGMKGKKKISDILIDGKIPLAEKQKVWLLESAGNICLIFGFGISESFKVKPDSKKIMKVRWKQ